jgi:pyruvate/2-oxoglutarate dehydrogenase complex dihydrolipoamide acyltransferase (E2) component
MLRFGFAAAACRRAYSAAAAPLPPHFVFTLPPLSPVVTSARVVAWHAAPGARLLPGDALCDVATDTLLEQPQHGDEVVLVIELHEEGTLAAVLQPAGGPRLGVDTPLALLVEDERDAPALAAAAARGYAGGDTSAVAPLWQAHLAATPGADAAPRGCH